MKLQDQTFETYIKKNPITITDYTLFPHITKPMIDIYDDVIL